jgi:DegV family protein with EDD domain
MSKIKLITDSTADLRPETYKELDIEVVPLIVNIGEESLKDGVDITLDQLYKRVKEESVLPKTAAVPPIVFTEVFNKYLEQGYEIIYMGIGSTLSLAFSSAKMALEEMPGAKVRLIDSLNLSTATGALLLKAAKLRDEGKEVEEIAEEIESLVKRTRAFFAVENLNFLYRGGRVSAAKYVLGTMIKAHPIIKVENGKLGVYKTPKGKMVKALDEMLEEVRRIGVDNIDLDNIMITHAFDQDSADYMVKKLVEIGIPKKSIYVSLVGTVIGTHCGPNTIGILFIEK